MHEVANMRIADDLKNVYGSKKVVTLSLIVNDSHQSLRELRQALKHRSLWMFSYSFLFTSMLCLTSKSLKTEVHISSESSALFSDKSFASLVYLLRGFRLTKYPSSCKTRGKSCYVLFWFLLCLSSLYRKVFRHFLCLIDCNLYSFYKAMLRFRWNRVKVVYLLL